MVFAAQIGQSVMNQEVAETGRQSGSQSGLKNQLTLNLMVHFISPFQATSSR